ncbi:hypothetical protein WMY93_033513 [Mugilogobius chulae]|uniref:Importin N-terminal domain-containing protein n=1 Tax=Mugilogobius chulae TaxID=88201 RepID=A0AAW0MNM8_9GOBI
MENLPLFLVELSKVLANPGNTQVARVAAGLQIKNSVTSKDPELKAQYQRRWLGIDGNARKEIKKFVLQTLGTENYRPSSASQCVAGIACAEIPVNQWPDLIQELVKNMTNSQSTEHMRESTLEAIGYICQDIDPEHLQEKANQILTAIIQGMRKEEPSNNVKLAATNALLNSLEFTKANSQKVTKANFDRESERHFIMQVVCEATQCPDTRVRVAALQNLVKIMSLYYQYMETYMGPALFAVNHHRAMKSDIDEVALQGIEFWSNVCDEEMDLAIEASEVGPGPGSWVLGPGPSKAAEQGRPPEHTSKFYAKGALQYLVPILTQTLTKQVQTLTKQAQTLTKQYRPSPSRYRPHKQVQTLTKQVQTLTKQVQTLTDPHQAGTDPHQAGTDPHQAGTDPHQTCTDPHQAGTDPHQTGTHPHQAGTHPHQAGTDPHQAGTDPHQAGTDPHQAGTDPHQTCTDPHQAGTDPHQTGTHPHQAGTHPHQAGTDPHQAGTDPHQTGTDPKQTLTKQVQTHTKQVQTLTKQVHTPHQAGTHPSPSRYRPSPSRYRPSPNRYRPKQTLTKQVQTLTKQDENDDDDDWNPCKAAGSVSHAPGHLLQRTTWFHMCYLSSKSTSNTPTGDTETLRSWRLGRSWKGLNSTILNQSLYRETVPKLFRPGPPKKAVQPTCSFHCKIETFAIISRHAYDDRADERPVCGGPGHDGLDRGRISPSRGSLSNVCWAFSSLAEAAYEATEAAEEQEEPATYCLSSTFELIVEKLLETTDRPDGHQNNLRSAAYEALMEIVKNSAKDCYPAVQKITLVIMERLRHVLQMESHIQSTSDRMQYNDLQSLLCATLQNVLRKVQHQDALHISDVVMESLLRMFQSTAGSGGVQEDALMAVSTLVEVLGADFQKYMDAFEPFLVIGLKNHAEYQVCLAAVGLVCDLCRALMSNILPYCDKIMNLLLDNLRNQDVHRSVKPQILSVFWDIALAIGGEFKKYLAVVVDTLNQASQAQVDKTDYDMVDYLNELREGCLEAYTGIIQGLKGDQENVIHSESHPNVMLMQPQVPYILSFIDHIAMDEDHSDGVVANSAGLIGDMCVAFGKTWGSWWTIAED